MATVRKRGSTYTYRVSYKDKRGRYKEITKGGFKTEAEAKRAGKILEAKIKENKHTLNQNMIAYDYIMEYYENKKKDYVGKSAQNRYIQNYGIFKDYFKDTKLKDITNYKYQAFLDDYSKGKAKGTVEKLHSQVRAAFKYAHANGYISHDPTFDVRLNYEKKAKPKEELFIHQRELEALVKELTVNLTNDHVSKHFLLLAIASGARFSELIGLTFDDYNPFKSEININKSYDHVFTHDYKETKTASSVRKVTIDSNTNKKMAEFIQHQKLDLRNKRNLIFMSPTNPSKPITHNAVLKELRKTSAKVGIENKIGIHALRHTHASLLLLNGLKIEYIAERLGHSDINTTQKYYLHIVEEMKKKSDNNVINIFKEMY